MIADTSVILWPSIGAVWHPVAGGVYVHHPIIGVNIAFLVNNFPALRPEQRWRNKYVVEHIMATPLVVRSITSPETGIHQVNQALHSFIRRTSPKYLLQALIVGFVVHVTHIQYMRFGVDQE